MITPVTQEFRLPVQQSGTNYSVNLRERLRRLFGIEKGDVLILCYDPASKAPLIVADIEKPKQGDNAPC